MAGPPRVYVHEDVNPPGNPKEYLQTNDYVLWKADLGNGPMTYRYEPKDGNWYPVSPQQMQMLLPEPTAPPPAQEAGARLGGTGAGSTTVAPQTTIQGQREEKARAGREKELQGAQDLTNLQERAGQQGTMGGLSIAERGQVQQLVNEGLSIEEAVQEVLGQRTAGTQADALESGSDAKSNMPVGPEDQRRRQDLSNQGTAAAQ